MTRGGRPIFLVLAGLLLALAVVHPAHGFCAGDCNGDHVVTIDELLAGVNMSLGGAVLTTCLNVDRNGDGEVTVDELIAAVTNALQGCAAQTQAFVVTTDFTTGSFGTIGLDSPHAVQQSSPQRMIFRDAVARAHDGLVYVINRLFADNIQVLDPANKFATQLECSTGNGTNPHDIAFVDAHKAYVSLFETPKLLIVNPSAQPNCKDFVLGTIDLSSLADADGNPDMDQMAIVDGRLYVSLERLNVHVILRPPAENGAIAVIDTATDQLLGGIELTGENPFSQTQGLTVRDGAIYIAESGLFGVLDGGIERVNLQTQQAEGFFVTEQDLGGDITAFALVSDHLAYAIISKPDFSTALIAFDPTTRQIINTLRQNAGFTLADIELNDRGELYVADRTPQASGVRIFRAADGMPLTDKPLDVLLPPFEIVFIP